MPLSIEALSSAFVSCGVRCGGVLLVHASINSLSAAPDSPPPSPDDVLDALLDALGPQGTLLIPTLSYLFVSEAQPVFNVTTTPSNLGALSSAMLARKGASRSLHPTHSVAAIGPLAQELTQSHKNDRTPVGPNSPFSLLKNHNGQVAFLGCGSRCNTMIHGVEECILPTPPPYLLLPNTINYTLIDENGVESVVEHRRHDFRAMGQRYEKLTELVPQGSYKKTPLFRGCFEIFDAKALWDTAVDVITRDPYALVCSCPPGEEEDHHLKTTSRDGIFYYSYTVGPRAKETEKGHS